jgi:outer membrane receptor protein involved in Fe transport
VIAALLWVVPAAAQEPVDPDADTASAEAGEATDPTDRESDLEERASEDSDLEEPDSADLDEALRRELREQASDIEEILITGERRSTLQDAPTSSTSFTAGDLQALRIENIADLADYTPNLEINTAFAASNPTIFIRGIGLKDYNANAAGAVAVYQDGININSPAIQLGQLFDIEGIDVMRGPQGSLNGRNATAGAILIRSAMPTGEFGVSTSLTYGNFNDREVEAAINIPLIEDMLSMRVAGTVQRRDGYQENQCAGWDPETLGFLRIDEASTRAFYDDLQPVAQYVQDPLTGEITPTFAKVNRLRRNGSTFAVNDTFVYLDWATAFFDGFDNTAIVTGGKLTPLILAEDLLEPDGMGGLRVATLDDGTRSIDANGDVFVLPNGTKAVAGTRVAAQGKSQSINEVDNICFLGPPGTVVTPEGAGSIHEGITAAGKPLEFNPLFPGAVEGEWLPSRGQPTLDEFAGLKRWTNNIDNWAARMVLLFTPMDNMEWMLNAHGTQNRGDSAHLQMLAANAEFEGGFTNKLEGGFSEDNAAITSGFRLGEGIRNVPGIDPDSLAGEGGGNPFSGFYSADGIEKIDAWGINGRGFWDLGDVVITLLYDYEWYDRIVEDEGDANPLRLFPAIWADSAWQTTEELRVEGEGERYKWTAGFFFLYEELDARNFFPDTQDFAIDQQFSQTLTSWAPYLSSEIDLVEEGVIPGIYELTLSMGARYNQEKKEFSLQSSATGTTSNVTVVQLPEDSATTTWREWTGDLKLSYTPFSNEYGTLLSYLSYGHGFKGGHFNAGLTIKGGEPEQDVEPVEPEFIDAIEFGIRSRWLDDRLILNAAVFRYWYQDLQVFDITNEAGALPIQHLLNGDAKVLGAEAELRVKPLPGLLISANMGWLDAEFEEFTVIKTIGQPRGSPKPQEFDYRGNRLVAAPTWNWSVISDYEIPLFGWGSLTPQWALNYRSKAYLDPQQFDPISQDGYWLHNARIAYRTPDDRIELAFWVSNIFEQEYKIDVFDLTRQTNTILEVWGEPRTYGVTLSLEW